ARRDHRVVFESLVEKAGGAPRRVVVEMAGEKGALFATALKLPEDWVRRREKWSSTTYVALVWKILGMGAVIGLLVVELFRLSRAGRVPWLRAAKWGALLALPAFARQIASLPLALRVYRPEFPFAAFCVLAGVGILVGLLLAYAIGLLAAALVLTASPDSVA